MATPLQVAGMISFLSTLSVRRATDNGIPKRVYIFISIHALREESDYWSTPKAYAMAISIHALREESDLHRMRGCTTPGNFYPRSP